MFDEAKTLAALQQHFGFDSLRPAQRRVLGPLLAGRPVLAVLPTGGGKSLCYQLPAVLLDGLTVVVSPLLALMKDQVDRLVARGVPAASIHSLQSPADRQAAEEALRSGALRLIYVSPERFVQPSFRRLLGRPALVAIDEAHCVSEWGHAFRPAYEQLGPCLADLRPRHLLALTATAGPEVRVDIVRSLRMQDAVVEVAGFDRPNLHLEGHVVRTDAEKLDTLAAALRGRTPAIVYAATRRRVESLTLRLAGLGHRTGAYHAGLTAEERWTTQDRFLAGQVDVVVATNAFGLGIDKPDVRLVAHVDPPLSVEAWYQEVGRAGRDGAPAAALLLHARAADRRLLKFLLRRASPVVSDVQLVHRTLAEAKGGLSTALLEARLTRLNAGRLPACLATLEALGATAREGAERFELRVRSDVAPEGESIESRLLRALGTRSAVVDDLRLRELLGCASRAELGTQLDAAVLQGRLRVRSTSGPEGAWVVARPLRGSDLDRVHERALRDEERLEQILQLARSRTCRRRLVLATFGETLDARRCGACDRCTRPLFPPVRSRLSGRSVPPQPGGPMDHVPPGC